MMSVSGTATVGAEVGSTRICSVPTPPIQPTSGGIRRSNMPARTWLQGGSLRWPAGAWPSRMNSFRSAF